MRLAIISDIHSNYHALEAVLADIGRRGVDQIICLGDITMKGPLPKECVDRVRALGCPTMLGNTDQCFHPDSAPASFPARNESQVAAQLDFERHVQALTTADRDWLINLPLTHTETVDGLRMDFFHAAPHHNYVLVMPWARDEEIEALRLSDETAMSAFGHCHRAFIRYVDGRLFVNAGAVGAPFDGNPHASYAFVDVALGIPTAAIVRVPYDAEAAVAVARAVGMAGWELFAHTARTGCFPG